MWTCIPWGLSVLLLSLVVNTGHAFNLCSAASSGAFTYWKDTFNGGGEGETSFFRKTWRFSGFKPTIKLHLKGIQTCQQNFLFCFRLQLFHLVLFLWNTFYSEIYHHMYLQEDTGHLKRGKKWLLYTKIACSYVTRENLKPFNENQDWTHRKCHISTIVISRCFSIWLSGELLILAMCTIKSLKFVFLWA